MKNDSAHHIQSLRRFYEVLNLAAPRLEEILEIGLKSLGQIMGFETASLFRWEEKARLLRMEYMLFKGELMEGEEEIPVWTAGPLVNLISGKVSYVLIPFAATTHVYLPLWVKHEFFGVVRLSGSQRSWTARSLKQEISLIEDMGRTLALRVDQAYLLKKYEEQLKELKALAEVGATVQESLKLREMLEGVSQSVLRNMGFDRVRFYLVEATSDTLFGVIGAEIPGRIINLESERYPLQKGHNPLVDSVLSARPQAFIEGSGRSIAYIPLMLKGKPIGVCVADNLLSQQGITTDKLEAMSTVAGQVALAVSNARLFGEIEEQAITDGLTKLYVVRYFSQRLQEEVDRAERYSCPLALVMLDVDKFKNFNDTYGHPMGDKVLEYIGQTIRANIRKVDLAARYGGDEMVILLPDISEQEAWIMTGRVFKSLNQCALTVPGGATVQVTVSMGVAMYPQDANSGHGLIECADHALYWAKAHGRADVCFYRAIASPDRKKA
jgi:diguanylate cyclase (GGDEF)-like protein